MVFFSHRGPPVAAGFLSLRDATVKETGGSVCVQNKPMNGDPQPERKIKIGHGGGDDEPGSLCLAGPFSLSPVPSECQHPHLVTG